MKLSQKDVEERVKDLDNWGSVDDFALTKEYELTDFKEALAFVNKIGELAEDMNHHPDISISYNNVALILSTHSEDGVSEKDFELAKAIDAVEG